MENVKVGIYLDDGFFAEALAKGLARHGRGMSFRLLDSAEDAQDCHIVLSSGAYGGSGAVRLVGRPEEESLDGEPFGVYRYKDSGNLVKDLLFIYFQMTGRVSVRRGDAQCRMLVFAACSGGCGTTSAALSLCRLLNRFYGVKCLYLSLCPLDDSKKYLPQEGGAGLLKLFYYLETNRPFPLEAFVAEADELDYIRTTAVNTYFDEGQTTAVERLLTRIQETGRYDFLVADIGNHLCRTNKKLLERADQALLFHSARTPVPGKYREEITREIDRRVGAGRLIHVENMVSDCWVKEDSSAELYVSAEAQLLTETGSGLFDLDLSGNYGNEIMAVAKRIMEEVEAGERTEQ